METETTQVAKTLCEEADDYKSQIMASQTTEQMVE